ANKPKRAIAHQRARKQACFAQDLKTVARSEHELARARIANHRLHNRRKTSDRAAAQIIAVSETARQDDRVVIAERCFFVPEVIGLQTLNAVDAGDTILVAIGTWKLNDGKLHVDLVSHVPGALFFMIIVHHETRVNHSWNPTEQR